MFFLYLTKLKKSKVSYTQNTELNILSYADKITEIWLGPPPQTPYPWQTYKNIPRTGNPPPSLPWKRFWIDA